MVRAIGIYRWKEGAVFDHARYRAEHLQTARALLEPLGLLRLESDEFVLGPRPGDGAIIAATYAYFESPATARAALSATGAALTESVSACTNLVPEVALGVVTTHFGGPHDDR
ncbi:MAG: hypothetical protein R2752_10455 [Vicinamibacterales bacterium]